MTATSLFLGSRAEGKSIIDLSTGKLRVLEENILNRPPCCVVEGLDTEPVISACWFSRCFWRGNKDC
jgi:hypothetical protein